MTTPSHDIQVHFDLEADEADVDLSRLESLVRAICTEFKLSSAEVNISIVDDTGIIQTHREFLGQDKTTDVISFDLSDTFEPHRTFQLVVNAQMAARQARQRGHSTEAELALYITHGLLHNLGFDDAAAEQARRMHEKEDELLQTHGFGIIYHSNRQTD